MELDASLLTCIMLCFVPSIAAMKWVGTIVSPLAKFNGDSIFCERLQAQISC